jgi:putative transposase
MDVASGIALIMPRRLRAATAGLVVHVLNRAATKARLFETDADYLTFERTLAEGLRRTPTRLLAYCVMPNHWHLLLWPRAPHQLSQFMQWITATHARRWRSSRGTNGVGAVYQARYKAVPVQADHHLLWVWRYVERNPVRAGLVRSADEWPWSSAGRRKNFSGIRLDDGPFLRPANWIDYLNEPQTEMELQRFRSITVGNRPYGSVSPGRQPSGEGSVKKEL